MDYLKPSFMIIGERKCATSSLYRYLIEHPQVLPCRLKEPQYFSRPFLQRLFLRKWYRGLFPAVSAESAEITWFTLEEHGGVDSHPLQITRETGGKVITGEASANTFAQVPPKRIKNAFPDIRLILCLRHPVDRAWAHYRMLQRFKKEGRRIGIPLTDFETDFARDIARGNEGLFAGVSLYADRLEAWADTFGLDRMTIVRTEDLAETAHAGQILSTICSNLELDLFDFSEILRQKENVSEHASLDPGLRKELMQYYVKDIQKLERLTGRNFNWTA